MIFFMFSLKLERLMITLISVSLSIIFSVIGHRSFTVSHFTLISVQVSVILVNPDTDSF